MYRDGNSYLIIINSLWNLFQTLIQFTVVSELQTTTVQCVIQLFKFIFHKKGSPTFHFLHCVQYAAVNIVCDVLDRIQTYAITFARY
jgi:hypothetical protein